MSDMCASPWCDDIATPGRDRCHACQVEVDVLAEALREEIGKRTAEHEAELLEKDAA